MYYNIIPFIYELHSKYMESVGPYYYRRDVNISIYYSHINKELYGVL
jgi:hypothetical protein